ncbi:MAG: hypothetical protein KKD44_25230 [Proteobacteria bacterium]|nr:hypothetical protein [Pseudomonadota bacterium]
MDLLNTIETVWAEGAEKKASKWAMELQKAKPMIAKAKATFHKWSPLKVYLSYTRAR